MLTVAVGAGECADRCEHCGSWVAARRAYKVAACLALHVAIRPFTERLNHGYLHLCRLISCRYAAKFELGRTRGLDDIECAPAGWIQQSSR